MAARQAVRTDVVSLCCGFLDELVLPRRTVSGIKMTSRRRDSWLFTRWLVVQVSGRRRDLSRRHLSLIEFVLVACFVFDAITGQGTPLSERCCSRKKRPAFLHVSARRRTGKD